MIDLAVSLDDLKWEHALESALRKKIVSIKELENVPVPDAGPRSDPPCSRSTSGRRGPDREPARDVDGPARSCDPRPPAARAAVLGVQRLWRVRRPR